MKTLKVVLGVSFVVFLAFACDQDLTSVKPNGQYDITLRQSYDSAQQHITPCEASNLTYYVDPSCIGSDYESAIIDAMNAYNALGLSIHLLPSVSANSADVVINCVSGGHCGKGITNGNEVYYPSGGKINNAIELNIDWSECRCLEPMPDEDGCTYPVINMPCVLQRTVMHEMGHVLGIQHNGSFEHIPGTPNVTYDENSVFNDGGLIEANCDYCNPACEFNNNDIAALTYLYPPCLKAPKISVTFDPCNSLIYLYETNNPASIKDSITQYNWSISGLNNSYLLSNNANPAVVRVLYGTGEELCVSVTVSNNYINKGLECGSSTCDAVISNACLACFLTPGCDGHGGTVVGTASNACSAGGACPAGFECVGGICCLIPPSVDSCTTNLECGVGFHCVNGICQPVQGDECTTNADCPPGKHCKNGECI